MTQREIDHVADVSKKVDRDCISRQAVVKFFNDWISCLDENCHHQSVADMTIIKNDFKNLPSAQPEIIHCGECIYYDPPHVEKEDARYEYSEMPKEAFDVLGTGLVSMEYGINIGGRCCRDYNVGYSEDKRVFVPENNYCGRAERK